MKSVIIWQRDSASRTCFVRRIKSLLDSKWLAAHWNNRQATWRRTVQSCSCIPWTGSPNYTEVTLYLDCSRGYGVHRWAEARQFYAACTVDRFSTPSQFNSISMVIIICSWSMMVKTLLWLRPPGAGPLDIQNLMSQWEEFHISPFSSCNHVMSRYDR